MIARAVFFVSFEGVMIIYLWGSFVCVLFQYGRCHCDVVFPAFLRENGFMNNYWITVKMGQNENCGRQKFLFFRLQILPTSNVDPIWYFYFNDWCLSVSVTICNIFIWMSFILLVYFNQRESLFLGFLKEDLFYFSE